MNEQDFIIERQKAVERMKKMSEHSATPKNGMPNVPHFVKVESPKEKNEEKNSENNNGFLPTLDLKDFNLPFLKNLKSDKDASLILGLILLLFCESDDKILLAALVYILL